MALGLFSLTTNGSASDLTITSAGTIVCTPIIGLSSIVGLLYFIRFAYGSGGSTVRAYLQTSADGGVTWVDVACALFGQVSKTSLLNFSSLTPKLTQIIPTDGTMADDTALDGVIGDKYRLKVVSTGIYGGSTVVSSRMVAR